MEFFNTENNSGASDTDSGTWTISPGTTISVNGNTIASASNAATNNTEVFSGNIFQPWSFGDKLDISLSTPFTYDPPQGNLLMTVGWSGVTDPGGEIFFDVNDADAGLGFSVNDANGNKTRNDFGLVTGFDEPNAVPEPSAILLLATITTCVCARLGRPRG